MNSAAETEREAAQWLARRESEGWSERDAQKLSAWLDTCIGNRVAFLRLQEAWNEAARLRALGAGLAPGTIPARGSWHEARGSARAQTPSGPPDLGDLELRYRREGESNRGRWRSRAAAALALAAIGLVGTMGWRAERSHQAIFSTALGQIESTTLQDGSHVTLSSDSRIEVSMDRARREVRLARGEAIFEVAHEPDRPFVVQADAVRATAIGTRFSVRQDGHRQRVVVTEGRVRFEHSAGDATVAPPVSLLSAGNVAFASDAGVRIESMPPGEAERLLEWRSGFLAFEDASLADAAAEFNRYNPRRLELADAAVADLRIGGNFRWGNPDGFANLLERAFPVRAERLPDRIVLHSR